MFGDIDPRTFPRSPPRFVLAVSNRSSADIARMLCVPNSPYSNTCTTSEGEIAPPAAMMPATARRSRARAVS